MTSRNKNDKRQLNIGFSMVEVLISMAIFALLITPIVSGIISSLKMSDNSKTLQYRNDFAENVVEYAKDAPIDEIMLGTYLKNLGTVDSSLTATTDTGQLSYNLEDSSGALVEHKLDYSTYMVSGSLKLGTASGKKDYSYVLEISNKEYAQMEQTAKDGKTEAEAENLYTDVNNLTTSTVENLDYTKVALINGTFANYDDSATQSFYTQKLQQMKVLDPDRYEQMLKNQQLATTFASDTGTRIITVRVYKDDATDEYVVACYLQYHDNSTWAVALDDIVYTVYATSFATLPNVYLMYNTCIYNGDYVTEDYVVFDTSGLDATDETNFFVVETAETYSEDIKNDATDAVKDVMNKTGDDLYRKESSNGRERDSVKIYLLQADGSHNISVYTNYGEDTKVNKTNSKIYSTASEIASSGSTLLHSAGESGKYSFNITYSSKNDGTSTVCKGIDTDSIKGIEDSQKANVGLYTVKFWIEEGDDPNDLKTRVESGSVEPVLRGTKGGGLINE